MELKEFLRPEADNSLGLHWRAGGPMLSNLEADLAFAKDIGVKWVLLCGTVNPTGPLSPAEKVGWRLKEEGIMVVFRPYCLINSFVNFENVAKRVVPITPWIQIFNEPENSREWREDGYVEDTKEYFSHRWIREAHRVVNIGGYPGLQCGLDQLDHILPLLKEPGNARIVELMWFCPHLYPISRPPWIWEDERCALGFVDFAQAFHYWLGVVPPMIVGEGGWSDGETKYDSILMASWYSWWFKGFHFGGWGSSQIDLKLPDYLFAICPWLLAGEPGFGWRNNYVYYDTIAWMKANHDYVRKFSWDGPQPEPLDSKVVSEWMTQEEAKETAEKASGMFPFYFGVEER